MSGRKHRPSPAFGENGTPGDEAETILWLENAICALLGLGAVAGVVFLYGQFLLTMTQGFAALSTTVLVFILVTLWVFVWITLEALWEWRAGRMTI